MKDYSFCIAFIMIFNMLIYLLIQSDLADRNCAMTKKAEFNNLLLLLLLLVVQHTL